MKSFAIGMLCVALVVELEQAAGVKLHDLIVSKSEQGNSHESQNGEGRRAGELMATNEQVEQHDGQAGSSSTMGPRHLADTTQEDLDKAIKTAADASRVVCKSECRNEGCNSCTNSQDCPYSSYCTGCYGCAYCQNCTNCRNSNHCSQCTGSSNCNDCKICINSSSCTGCTYCVGCNNCQGCTNCTNCYNCTNCHGCTNCSNRTNCSNMTC